MQRCLAAIAPTIALLFALEAAAADVPWPTAGWETSTPEAQGMSSDALARLVDFGAANQMDSLLVVRHGRIVAEAHYAPFRAGTRHAINSVTKAVTGTLIGIAQQQGLIGRLDQPVLELLADRSVPAADERKKALALEHLLDMTSGLDWQEPLSGRPQTAIDMEQTRDWPRFVLERPMAQAPGIGFNYNSGNSHLLSAIIAAKSGRSTLDFAREQLFKPLGITDIVWRQDPQGLATGGFGLYMLPRDMAKIGYLYLRRGQWDGRQLIPAAWVDKIEHATVDMHLGTTPPMHYANGWWTMPDKRAYMAVGFLNQVMLVLPEHDAVLVTTGRTRYPLAALVDGVATAVVAGTAVADDAAARQRLAQRIRVAATQTPTPVPPLPDTAKRISGRTYEFARNLAGLKSLRLLFDGGVPRYEAEVFAGPLGLQRLSGPIGLDGTFHVDERPDAPVAVKGQWVGEHSFSMVSRWLTEGVVANLALRFDGERKLHVTFGSNRGPSGEFDGEARGD
jgi:CubicO group peptidase (beta-lactamase class C family)